MNQSMIDLFVARMLTQSLDELLEDAHTRRLRKQKQRQNGVDVTSL
ncbi:hypothetical protein [Georgenia alba]|uniref:IS256 family transposase n=1 Tax=Georgenia alba TaxID=2233858 RepID=A0ABW2Q2I3_9MICO